MFAILPQAFGHIRSNNIRRKAPWSPIETGQKDNKGGSDDWNPRLMNVTSIPKYVTSWIYWCSIESLWSKIALYRVHQLTCGVYDDLWCCLKLLMLMYFLYLYSEKYIDIDCFPAFKSQPISSSTPNAKSPCLQIPYNQAKAVVFRVPQAEATASACWKRSLVSCFFVFPWTIIVAGAVGHSPFLSWDMFGNPGLAD